MQAARKRTRSNRGAVSQRPTGRRLGRATRRAVGTERVLVLLGDFDRALVDVDPRRLRRGVPEDGLDGRLADAAVGHLGGESVTEGMGRNLALDPERLAELGDDVLDRGRADRAAGVTQFIPSAEGGEGARPAGTVAAGTPVGGEGLGGLGVEVDGPALAALG